jgi:hypothetical protein
MTELMIWQIAAVTLYALGAVVFGIEADSASESVSTWEKYLIAWTWPLWAVLGIVLLLKDEE